MIILFSKKQKFDKELTSYSKYFLYFKIGFISEEKLNHLYLHKSIRVLCQNYLAAKIFFCFKIINQKSTFLQSYQKFYSQFSYKFINTSVSDLLLSFFSSIYFLNSLKLYISPLKILNFFWTNSTLVA